MKNKRINPFMNEKVHYKLVKSTKGWLTIGLTTIGLATAALLPAPSVHADETPLTTAKTAASVNSNDNNSQDTILNNKPVAEPAKESSSSDSSSAQLSDSKTTPTIPEKANAESTDTGAGATSTAAGTATTTKSNSNSPADDSTGTGENPGGNSSAGFTGKPTSTGSTSTSAGTTVSSAGSNPAATTPSLNSNSPATNPSDTSQNDTPTGTGTATGAGTSTGENSDANSNGTSGAESNSNITASTGTNDSDATSNNGSTVPDTEVEGPVTDGYMNQLKNNSQFRDQIFIDFTDQNGKHLEPVLNGNHFSAYALRPGMTVGTLPDDPVYQKQAGDNYDSVKFDGWYYRTLNGISATRFLADTVVNRSYTLMPKFTFSYVIKYEVIDSKGTTVTETRPVVAGDSADAIEPDFGGKVAPRDNARFVYWYADNDNNQNLITEGKAPVAYQFGIDKVTAPLTLKAYYADVVKVDFMDGSKPVSSQIIDRGTVANAVNPNKDGYTFIGWSTTAGVTPNQAKVNPALLFNATTTQIKADTTLYGIWTPDTVNYSLVFWIEKLNGDVPYTKLVDDETYNTVGKLASTDKVTVDKIIPAPNKTTADAYVQALLKDAPDLKYAEFSHADSTVNANGDGSAIVNVYYNLINYQFNFDLTTQADRVVTGMGVEPGANVPASDTYMQRVDMSGLKIETSANVGQTYTFFAKYGENLAGKWPLINGNGEESGRLINADGSDRQVLEAKQITYPDEVGSRYPGVVEAYVFDYHPDIMNVGDFHLDLSTGKTYDVNNKLIGYDPYIQQAPVLTDKVDFMTWSNQGNYYKITKLQSNLKYVPSVTDEIVATANIGHTVTLTPIFSLANTDYSFIVTYSMQDADDNGYTPMKTDTYLSNVMYYLAKVVPGAASQSPHGINTLDDQVKNFSVTFNRHTYNLEFDMNDKTGGDTDDKLTLTYKYQQHLKNADVNNHTFPKDPVRPGYTFGGWYLDSNCLQPFVDKSGNYAYATMPAQNVTLYAKWTKNDSHVYYFSDYATYLTAVNNQQIGVAPAGSIDTQTYKNDTRLALPEETFDNALTSTSRGVFDHWNMMQGNSAVALSDGYAVNNDLYVFASYQTVKFSVVYKGVNAKYSGSIAEDKNLYGYETSIKLADAPKVLDSNADQVFIGWEINNNFYLPGDFAVIDGSIAPDVDLSKSKQDLNFQAIYLPQSQLTSLIYHPNLSDLAGRDVTKSVPENQPTKLFSQDYFDYPYLTLAGWQTDDGILHPANGIYTTGSTTTPTNLYGIWYADASLGKNQRQYDGSNIQLNNTTDLISGKHVKLSQFSVADFDWKRDGQSVSDTDLSRVGDYTYQLKAGTQALTDLENSNKNIDFSHLLKAVGQYRITKMPVVVQIQGPTIVYDGTPRTVTDLLNSHQIKITYEDGQGKSVTLPDKGGLALEASDAESKNPVTYLNASDYQIELQEKTDSTSALINSNYEVKIITGKFSITPISLAFSLTSSGKVYDGKPISYQPVLSINSTNVLTNAISDTITLDQGEYQIIPSESSNQNLKNPGNYLIKLGDGINNGLANWYQNYLSSIQQPLVLASGLTQAEIQAQYMSDFFQNFRVPADLGTSLTSKYIIQGIPATASLVPSNEPLTKAFDGKAVSYTPVVQLTATETTFDVTSLSQSQDKSVHSIALNDAVDGSESSTGAAQQKLLTPVVLADGDYKIVDHKGLTDESHPDTYTIRLTTDGVNKIINSNSGFIFDRTALENLKLQYLITDNGIYAVTTTVQFVDQQATKPVKTQKIVGNPGEQHDVSGEVPTGYLAVPDQNLVVTVPDKSGVINIKLYQQKSKTGNPSYAVTTIVRFVDSQTSQPVKELTIVDKPGEEHDVSGEVPTGYLVVPDQNLVVTVPDQSGAIDIKLYQQKSENGKPVYGVTANVQFIDSLISQPVKEMTIIGNPGEQHDVSGDVPTGYLVLPGQNLVVTVPDKSGAINIQLYQQKGQTGKPLYAITTMVQLINQRTGEPVKSFTIVGNPGEQHDISQLVPNGYAVVPGQDTTVTVPDKPGTIDIQLYQQKTLTDKPVYAVTTTVQLVDHRTGNPVKTITLVGNPGEQQNVSQQVPNGYTVVPGQDTTVTVPDKPGTIDIQLYQEKTPINQPVHAVTTTVQFVDHQTGKPVKTLTIVGNPGEQRDVSQQVPNDYQVVTGQPTQVAIPQTTGTVTVAVQKVPDKAVKPVPSDWDPIDVIFVTTDGSRITEHEIEGRLGDKVDISQFIPAGYHLANGQGDKITLNDVTPQYVVLVPDQPTQTPKVSGPNGINKGFKQDNNPINAHSVKLNLQHKPISTTAPLVAGAHGKIVSQRSAQPALNLDSKVSRTTNEDSQPAIERVDNVDPSVAAPAGRTAETQVDQKNDQSLTIHQTSKQTAKPNQLPQTDEVANGSVLAMLGVVMASVLSFFGFARRKKETDETK